MKPGVDGKVLMIFFCVYYQSDYCVGAQSKSNKFSLSLSLFIAKAAGENVGTF